MQGDREIEALEICSDGLDHESCQIGDKCTDEQYQAVLYIPETIKNIACEGRGYIRK